MNLNETIVDKYPSERRANAKSKTLGKVTGKEENLRE